MRIVPLLFATTAVGLLAACFSDYTFNIVNEDGEVDDARTLIDDCLASVADPTVPIEDILPIPYSDDHSVLSDIRGFASGVESLRSQIISRFAELTHLSNEQVTTWLQGELYDVPPIGMTVSIQKGPYEGNGDICSEENPYCGSTFIMMTLGDNRDLQSPTFNYNSPEPKDSFRCFIEKHQSNDDLVLREVVLRFVPGESDPGGIENTFRHVSRSTESEISERNAFYLGQPGTLGSLAVSSDDFLDVTPLTEGFNNHVDRLFVTSATGLYPASSPEGAVVFIPGQ